MSGPVGTIITLILTETQIDNHGEKVTGSLPLARIFSTELEIVGSHQ